MVKSAAEIATALRDIAKRLETTSDAPSIDAQYLVARVLGKDVTWVLTNIDAALTDPQIARLDTLVAERKTGKPLAYILGWAEFYGRRFFVNENVLVPRPETETLIEQAIKYIKDHAKNSANFTITDIGTGSGIIAITLALELPNLNTIVATDISSKALEIAKQNAAQHGVVNRIEFLQGDMLKPLQNRHIDLIVSNPPYVPTQEIDEAGSILETRGLLFEPRIALDGGPDGQDFVDQVKNSGIPAFIETINGEVLVENMD